MKHWGFAPFAVNGDRMAPTNARGRYDDRVLGI